MKFAAELIGALAFLVMFAAFILQVFTRYVLNNPLGWTTELSVIAFLWMAFWGAGLVARERDHVRFDLLYQSLPAKGRRVLAVISTAVLAAVFLAALPANYDFVVFMAEDRTWVLEIRFDFVFAVFIVFLVAFGLRAVWRVAKLCGRRWRDEI